MQKHTCAILLDNINEKNEHEKKLGDKVHPCMNFDFSTYPTFRLHQTRYEEDAVRYHKAEIKARAVARSINLQDRSKPQAMRTAIDGSTSMPLLCLVRDKPGSHGEKVGTYTSNPKEVDDIARRAWGGIYEGNTKDKESKANAFVKKHAAAIFTDKGIRD